LPGRALDLLAGLSMLFLALSGVAMYFDLWRRRQRGGRAGFFWV